MSAPKLCPVCGIVMATFPGANRLDHLSRDHILPRVRGGKGVMHGGTRNIRIMCQRCNGELAMSGHCMAALACAEAVAHAMAVPRLKVIQFWKFARTTNRAQAAIDAARRAKSAEAVSRARQITRERLKDYIHPADSAAKRVWNMATLARYSDGAPFA